MKRSKKPFEDTRAAACEAAAGLLARREHAERELRQKLQRKGFSSETLDEAMAELLARDWLNPSRYAAAMVRHRASQGRGPRWLQAELQSKGVQPTDIEEAIAQDEVDWQQSCDFALSRMLRGDDKNLLLKCRQKLYQRGFHSEHIDTAIRCFEQRANERVGSG
ncbi:MAG: regulatory protein RecX [Oceanococcus sp.]